MGYQDCLKDFKSIDLKAMREKGFLKGIHRSIDMKVKKVNAKSGWKKVTQCPLCASKKKGLEFKNNGIGILECKECSLRYVSSMPVNTGDVYSDDAYLPLARKRYMSNVSYRMKRFGLERLQLIKEQIGGFKGKHLMDVGCGTGWFLEIAKKKGFTIHGQELGKELAQWTAKRLKTDIITDSFMDISGKNKYDVITMFDLLEHVPDPLGLMKKSKTLLKKGGIIVVFTPNFDCLANHIMKSDSNMITPTDHLSYFTEKSVRVLAKKCRLKMEYFKTCGIDLGDIKSFFELKKQKHLEKACEELYDYIQPIVDQAGAGNHLRFILSKSASR